MYEAFENWSDDTALPHAVLVETDKPGITLVVGKFRDLFDAKNYATAKENESLVQLHNDGKFLAQADASIPGFNLGQWVSETLAEKGLAKAGTVLHTPGSKDFVYAAGDPVEIPAA